MQPAIEKTNFVSESYRNNYKEAHQINKKIILKKMFREKKSWLSKTFVWSVGSIPKFRY